MKKKKTTPRGPIVVPVVPIPQETRLLNIKQAAAYLSCTVSAIRHLVWAGKLPHMRIGRFVQIDRADLNAFVESQKVVAA